MTGSGSNRSMGWLAAGIFVIGLVLVIVQWQIASKLRQENQALRQEQEEVHRLRTQVDEAQPSQNQAQEIERLRADHQELLRLRNEVSRLRPQAKEMEKLRAEIQRLQEDHKARLAQLAEQAPVTPVVAQPTEERMESIACINHLKQIGLAGRIYANNHNNLFPPDFLAMKEALSTPRILICPGDKTTPRPESADWTNFDPGTITYQMISPGAQVGEPNRIFAQCPAHGHVCYSDGSVVMGKADANPK